MPKSMIAEALATLTEEVKKIGERVSVLETPKERVLEVKTPEVSAPVKDDYSEPVPTEFREAVDLILNKNFEIVMDSRETPGAFGFSILVPKKYSNHPPFLQGLVKEDRRFKAIQRAEGVLGVKEYATRVFNNLSQDARTQIVIDRNN